MLRFQLSEDEKDDFNETGVKTFRTNNFDNDWMTQILGGIVQNINMERKAVHSRYITIESKKYTKAIPYFNLTAFY